MSKERTFARITNQDILDEIKGIHSKLEDFQKSNSTQHNLITIKQTETNGKVKLNRWISSTALGLVLMVFGWVTKFR